MPRPFQIYHETVNTSSEIQKGKGPLSFRLLQRKPLPALKPRLKIKVGSLRPTLMLLKFWWETLRSWISVIGERPGPHHGHTTLIPWEEKKGSEEDITCSSSSPFPQGSSSWPLLPYKQGPLGEMGTRASPNQCNQG